VHIANREGILDFTFYPIACAPCSKKKMHTRIEGSCDPAPTSASSKKIPNTWELR